MFCLWYRLTIKPCSDWDASLPCQHTQCFVIASLSHECLQGHLRDYGGFGLPQVQEQYNLSCALSCQTSAAICTVQLIYSEAIPAKALKAENLAG